VPRKEGRRDHKPWCLTTSGPDKIVQEEKAHWEERRAIKRSNLRKERPTVTINYKCRFGQNKKKRILLEGFHKPYSSRIKINTIRKFAGQKIGHRPKGHAPLRRWIKSVSDRPQTVEGGQPGHQKKSVEQSSPWMGGAKIIEPALVMGG